ncbi:hypothetical protein FRB93_001221 [Tulasnella sp. JGI-2019a]|nr:hypothetical protein FRB93_001221 [Tulasnella sp. JGI-2019a]
MTSTLPPLTQAVSGGVGSFTANAVLFPLDVVVTHMQTNRSEASKKKKGWNDFLREIVEEEGWSGLYSGFVSDSLATLLSNFIYFYTYTSLRGRLLAVRIRRAERLKTIPRNSLPHPYPPRHPNPIALSTAEELSAGFIAGVISRLISTPLSVVTVRMQAGGGRHKKTGVISALKSIYRDEGILGLWKGLGSTIILCSNPAITLFLFQLYRRFLPRDKTPTASQAFIGGAVPNALAVALLYPAIIIKTIVQNDNNRQSPTVSEAFNEILTRHGISGLYDGLQPQLAKGFFKEGLTMMTKRRVEALVIALYMLTRDKTLY